MKAFFTTLFVIFQVFCLAFAQTPPTNTPEEIKAMFQNTTEIPEMYISKISFDDKKKNLTGGEILSGVMEVLYPNKSSIEGVQVFLSLGTDIDDIGFPRQKLSRIQLGTLDFPGGRQTIDVPFSVTIPDLALKNLNIYVDFLSSTGAQIGFYNGDDIFTVKGKNSSIKVLEAYIQGNIPEKKYALSQGPGIGQGTPNDQLSVLLSLDTELETIDFQLEIYKNNITDTLLEKKNISLTKNTEGIFSYEIPKDLESGVYAAQLSAQSEDGVVAPIVFRWIVAGQSALIQQVAIDEKDILAFVTGTPSPATYGEYGPVEPNIDAAIVGLFEGQEFFRQDISLIGYTENISIPTDTVAKKGGEVTIQVQGRDKKILSTASVVIKPQPSSFPLYHILIGALLALLLLIAYFFKKKTPLVTAIFCLVLIGFLFPPETYALSIANGYPTYSGHSQCSAEGYTAPTMTLSSPVNGATVQCGGQINLTGTFTHKACANTGVLPGIFWYRFASSVTGAASAWAEVGRWYTGGAAGGGHSWNNIDYGFDMTITAPQDVTLYDTIQFYMQHDTGCNSVVYYNQPITSSCYTCGGAVPANANLCVDDNQNLTANGTNTLTSTCGSATKCEYTCRDGFKYVPAVAASGSTAAQPAKCEAIKCAPGTLPTGASFCTNPATSVTPVAIDRFYTNVFDGNYRVYLGATAKLPDFATENYPAPAAQNTFFGGAETGTVMGYVFPTQAPGTFPLIELVYSANAKSFKYMLKDAAYVRPAGYIETRIVGYVPKTTSAANPIKTIYELSNSYVPDQFTYSDVWVGGQSTWQRSGNSFPLLATSAAYTIPSFLDDQYLTGFADIPFKPILSASRSVTQAANCTAGTKCEWYCPVATPYFCSSSNTCVANSAACGGVTVTKTAQGNLGEVTVGGEVSQCRYVEPGTAPGTYKARYTITVKNTRSINLTNINLYDSRSKSTQMSGTYPATAPSPAVEGFPSLGTGYHSCNARFFSTNTSLNSPISNYLDPSESVTSVFADNIFAPGEEFSYSCIEDNIPLSDFIGDTFVNRIYVSAQTADGTADPSTVSTVSGQSGARVCLQRYDCVASTLPTSQASTVCPNTPKPLTQNVSYRSLATTDTCGTTAAYACTYKPICTGSTTWNDVSKTCVSNATCTGSIPTGATGGGCFDITNTLYRPSNNTAYNYVGICPASPTTDAQKCTFTCPAGSRYDTSGAAPACVTVSCSADTRYVANSTKASKCCTAQEIIANTDSCGTGDVCNNNGVCDANEGCGCPDCTPNPNSNTTNPADHCSTGNVCTGSTTCTGVGRGMCCPVGNVFNCATNTCTTCTSTIVPSEVQADVDRPLIECKGDPANPTATHFRYGILRTGPGPQALAPTISTQLYPLGTRVEHPALPLGEYTVSCLYGTASNTNAALPSYGMTVSSCTKNISSKASAQGCSNIYPYRGNTLSDSMRSPTSFDASFRCESRQPYALDAVRPYFVQVGTALPAYLGFDGVIGGLGMGLSLQSNNYSITSTTGSASCAVKVGEGYSTNDSCKIDTCVGAACSNPTTFIVVPSSNEECTTTPTTEYSIGCNPTSADYNVCIARFNIDLNGANSKTFDMDFKISGSSVPRPVTCTRTLPESASNFVLNCKTSLPTGEIVSIWTGDYSTATPQSWQSISFIKTRDITNPAGSVEYVSNGNTVTPSSTQWFNRPVTAKITCTNPAGSGDPEAADDACKCAPEVFNATLPDSQWISLPPVLDIALYQRTFNVSTSSFVSFVRDTAGNIGAPISIAEIKIDQDPPNLISPTAVSGSTVTLKFQDSLSGIEGIKYYKHLQTDTSTIFTGNGCESNITLQPASGITIGSTSQQTVTVQGFNGTTDKISYCVRDIAGNVLIGSYGGIATPVGCFSDSRMNPIPTLLNYGTSLATRMSGGEYGYGMTESAANAQCFRSIISTNVASLVSSQYTPTSFTGTSTTIQWGSAAMTKGTPPRVNTNGYYYYSATGANAALIVDSAPTSALTRTVVVEGGNIQINSDITGDAKKLILIAKKNSSGSGGNIYIHPDVREINAILIADGTLASVKNGAVLNWVANQADFSRRLIVKGRIYSLNTRGGSLKPGAGGIFGQAGDTEGKYFDTSGTIYPTIAATIFAARVQDLERFRYINSDGNNQCTLHVNYLSIPTNELPPILIRPSGITGTCGF